LILFAKPTQEGQLFKALLPVEQKGRHFQNPQLLKLGFQLTRILHLSVYSDLTALISKQKRMPCNTNYTCQCT